MDDFYLEMAKQFHEAYERKAAEVGYITRKDTREFDPESPNGKLMIAVCKEILPITDFPAGLEKIKIRVEIANVEYEFQTSLTALAKIERILDESDEDTQKE